MMLDGDRQRSPEPQPATVDDDGSIHLRVARWLDSIPRIRSLRPEYSQSGAPATWAHAIIVVCPLCLC